MDTLERISFITELADRDANIGKTGMMKLLYLLQTVFHIPLEYEFEIYTYGPYSQTIMSDIEFAEFSDYIRVTPVIYSNAMSGYQINATGEGKTKINKELIYKYDKQIDSIIDFFGQKTAKELELYSTIVFIAASFSDNGWGDSVQEICNTVKKTKPHFSIDSIIEAYSELLDNDFLFT